MRVVLSGIECLSKFTQLFLLDPVLDVLHILPQFDLQLPQLYIPAFLRETRPNCLNSPITS